MEEAVPQHPARHDRESAETPLLALAHSQPPSSCVCVGQNDANPHINDFRFKFVFFWRGLSVTKTPTRAVVASPMNKSATLMAVPLVSPL